MRFFFAKNRTETQSPEIDWSPIQGRPIEGLADHYVKALTKFQPEGPLMIGGYCIGAIIALDMAKKLRAMGREVGPVIAIVRGSLE